MIQVALDLVYASFLRLLETSFQAPQKAISSYSSERP